MLTYRFWEPKIQPILINRHPTKDDKDRYKEPKQKRQSVELRFLKWFS